MANKKILRDYGNISNSPPTGKNDHIFPAEGAEPYKQHLENLEYHLIDTGHFVLETHGAEVAQLIRDFLGRYVGS